MGIGLLNKSKSMNKNRYNGEMVRIFDETLDSKKTLVGDKSNGSKRLQKSIVSFRNDFNDR